MQDLINEFKRLFNSTPLFYGVAPGRLEILGNHTDYNEGFVLSCAVTQHTEMLLEPVSGTLCKIGDGRDGSVAQFDLNEIAQATPGEWSNYIRGVIVELAKLDIKIGAFNAVIRSNVPLSAGMSSSAALEMSAAMAFSEAFNIDLTKAQWARIGQGTENNYMGLKSGLLDQFSSLYGEKDALILSDFRKVEVLETICVPQGYALVVANSMVKHNLVDSAYNDRREDCESAAKKLSTRIPNLTTLRDATLAQLEENKELLTNLEYLRAKHVIGENERVFAAIAALKQNDVATFGKLLTQSHDSSVENFENSSDELNILVEFAKQNDLCLGARLSGGGFGGITIHFVAEQSIEEYTSALSDDFEAKVGVKPQIIVCHPGDGATSRRLA